MVILIKRLSIFSKCSCMTSPVLVKEKEDMNVGIINETMSALLHDNSLMVVEDTEEEKMVCSGGDGGICDGGAGDGSNGGETMDVHYQNLIKAHPCDPLILANYVKFLKEVRGDAVKAEEMCEKAILESGNIDGNILSMYGHLIWNNHKDLNKLFSLLPMTVLCLLLMLLSYEMLAKMVMMKRMGEKNFSSITCKQAQISHIFLHGHPPLAAA